MEKSGRHGEPVPAPRDALAAVLRTGPFHVARRAAIGARGLSLDRLRYRLAQRGVHVGVGTLSYWQSGRRRPERPESLRAVAMLEDLLDLPAGALTVLIGPPRPRGRAPGGAPRGSRRYVDLLPTGPPIDVLLAEIDSVGDGRLHIVAQYEQVELGPAGDTRSVRCLQVVQAHAEVDRYVVVYHGDAGCRVEAVTPRAVQNCRLGRVRRSAGSALVAAELLFDRRVAIGETHLLEYAFDDTSGAPAAEYRRGFRFPAGNYVLQVRFAAPALPVRCYGFTRDHLDGPETGTAELSLTAEHAAHVVHDAVRPSVLGIRWDWT
jgi:hypothetical protein